MFGNTDKPINKISNDTFGVSDYVEGLSNFILNCDTPMTISIQGDWGSGKTSMMSMIREKIDLHIQSIWFNTWQFSQFKLQDELAITMLYSLLSELDYNKDNIKKIFSFLGGAVKMATGIVTEKIAGGYLAGEITDAMSNNSYEYTEEIKKLKEQFQEAINSKIKSGRGDRIVIFIDDLDRLQPGKAVELLEVLKIFLDCENCVYVLAVDYAVVTQGIKEKFGDFVDEQKGKSFFDKIIQLPFKMPVAQYDITKYVANMLVNMGVDFNNKTVDDYVELISLSIGCNPRSIKRLFNTYLLLNIILKKKLLKQLQINMHKILFAVICMQMEYEGLYKYVVSNSNTLDYDFFNELENDILTNNEFKEELNISDDNELNKILGFIKKFNSIININESDGLNKRINLLKDVLTFSTVTSINVSDSIEETNDFDWKYRYINKDIVSNVNSRINEKCGYEFKIWLPRKNKSYHRLSDVWGIVKLKSEDNIYFDFSYSLKTDYSVGITKVNLYLDYKNPSTESDFDNLFYDNPLPYKFTKRPGSFVYENVLKFSDNESNSISDNIVEIIYDSLIKLKKFTIEKET